MHKRSQERELVKKPFIDDYAFDIGFNQAYSIVIFCMIMIFSGINPLISVFGFFYFTFKYYIDKYNLTFVYQREFESGGEIKKQVIPLTLISIYIFQLANIGFFTTRFKNFKVCMNLGFDFMLLQTIVLILLYLRQNNKKKQIARLQSEEQLDKSIANLEGFEVQKEMLGKEQTVKVESPSKKDKLFKNVNNLLNDLERRLTMPGQEDMSEDNLRRLREAYRHPFDKIPPQFFQLAQDQPKHTEKKISKFEDLEPFVTEQSEREKVIQ